MTAGEPLTYHAAKAVAEVVMAAPLDGITVVDLGQIITGPMAARLYQYNKPTISRPSP